MILVVSLRCAAWYFVILFGLMLLLVGIDWLRARLGPVLFA